MSKWIRKGDKVLVISGNNRGKNGEVLSVRGEKVVIQGINIRKRHMKRRAKVGAGEIIEMEKPIHISNVCLCNADGNPVKVKVRFTAQGEKQLYFIDGQTEVVHRVIKKTV
ncbi:MAG: 50S ribosomal protein L24 [Chlamydiae bacterium]|nr:50S ribosomal protein L24 [Chlamydiota bacterium]